MNKKLSKTVNRVILASLAIIMLYGIALVTDRLNYIRETEDLTDTSIAENAPPIVAFTTVALGSFRGLVADLLWLRSVQAREKGNYFEMVQLASWIVKLQPRFTDAAAYLAWNMAYNVSVTFSDFEDRWRWVQRGIELIRDEALVYNPGDPTLYKELGWIYQNKLGQELDDANRYYKVQLAKQMMKVLGEWPVDWERLAASPPTKNAFFERLTPEKEATLKRVLAENEISLNELESQFRLEGKIPQAIAPALNAVDLSDELTFYFRKAWLREQYKLDAELILELNRQYGKLDWRLPEAHALYWATLGQRASEQEVDTACERMILQSLANAFRGGRLLYLGDVQALGVTPNIAVVDATDTAHKKALQRPDSNVGSKAGYENFLIDATVTLYTFGRTEKAREYLGKLRENFQSNKYKLPLNRFVLRELAGDIQTATYDQGQSMVQGYLYQMYQALAFGDFERGEAFESIARAIWERYMQDAQKGRERRALPPYDQMKFNMYKRCLETFPEALKKRLTQAADAPE